MKKALLSVCLTAFLASGIAFAGKAEDLRWAVSYNRMDKVVEYLDAGYDVNSVTTDGFTPLMIAAEQDNETLVAYLLKRGANPSLKSDSGKKAIDYTMSRTIKTMLAKAEGISLMPVQRLAPKAKTPVKASPAKQAANPPTDHCRKMYGMSYKLCGPSDYSCKIKAANDYKKCQTTGTWY